MHKRTHMSKIHLSVEDICRRTTLGNSSALPGSLEGYWKQLSLRGGKCNCQQGTEVVQFMMLKPLVYDMVMVSDGPSS